MRLADWMLQKKLNDTDMAKKLGLPRVTVRQHRLGLRRPRDPNVIEKYRRVTRGRVKANDWYALEGCK